MKTFGSPLLSFAAPLLILIGLFGFFQRQGVDRWQALPAFLVGSGLIVSGALERRRRRRKFLVEIRKRNNT